MKKETKFIISWRFAKIPCIFTVLFEDGKKNWTLKIKNPKIKHSLSATHVYVCDNDYDNWQCKDSGYWTWHQRDIKTARRTWNELIRNGLERA